ncbi:MAG: hypothetical protein NTW28_25575 [Candidatus Solibacter sp.]|nr:hypothetical protein [Candidatus Solibacter sp.]
MKTFAQIDRSLVAVFDIEAFSDRTPEKQAQLVNDFLDSLAIHMERLGELQPDAFLTGDGAIVSIGRRSSVDASRIRRFLDFAIDFTAGLCRDGLIIRTALNYSECDRIVFAEANVLAGQYIQVGDTINIAARTLSFCEPREIMLTAGVQKLLRNHELEDVFPVHHNEPLVTKHGLRLDTYTYVPPAHLQDALYSPTAPSHPYKRFTAFPPIKADTLRYFMANGLDNELRKVITNAYDAISYINETKTFLSSSEVLRVLTRPNYDPDDTVYVVSRNDRRTGFWTQKRRSQYINYLAGHAAHNGGYINQTRLWVYDDTQRDELMPTGDIFEDLERLHCPKTFYNFPASLLENYDYLSQLIFGFTLSKKHRYAIIPVPAVEPIDANKLRTEHIGELLHFYRNYDAADGPMKAIITADETFVATLVAEFENAIRDPTAAVLK